MHFPRSSGILLHPTSLPGRYGIGDLGPAAYQFVDFLVDAGQSLWQILPLGPTGYGNSPYQSPSAFAGNPLLINLDALAERGLLPGNEIADLPEQFLVEEQVNYDAVRAFKMPLLRRSCEIFRSQRTRDDALTKEFAQFCETHTAWLDDYALFMAVGGHFGTIWSEWDREIALRQANAVEQWKTELAEEVEFHKYLQYLFFDQWFKLKNYANNRGVQIIGDIPIYVSYDSADVWANSHLFKLDQDGNPTVVAGVPPDYFSATGQRWGNPIYEWEKMARNDYAWWMQRMRHTLTQVDIVRIDHFLGLESFWEIPAEEETAVNGKWVKGPGAQLFSKLGSLLGDLPIIAEDLGMVTEAAEKLRDQFNLPGMKVLHFAFGDDSTNPYLPHNYRSDCVVYTGTHDNNTTIGWFESLGDSERESVQRYLGRDGSDIAWDLMRLALMSVAHISIFPVQDVLRLGVEARMNVPGTSVNNWEWRFCPEMLTSGLAQGVRLLTQTYGRCE